MSTLVDMTVNESHALALRAMEAAYQAHKTEGEKLIAAREELIRASHTSGMTIREIAAELDVSFQLIGRIIGRDTGDARAA